MLPFFENFEIRKHGKKTHIQKLTQISKSQEMDFSDPTTDTYEKTV